VSSFSPFGPPAEPPQPAGGSVARDRRCAYEAAGSSGAGIGAADFAAGFAGFAASVGVGFTTANG